MKFDEELKFNGKLGFFNKSFYLIKNYFYWKVKNLFFKNVKFRNLDYIKNFYDKTRLKLDLQQLSFEEFIFGQDYLSKKKEILFQNEIYFDFYYKPTLFRYLRLHNFIKSKLKKGDFVLDIGCGWGSATFFLAKLNPDINFIGIDLSKESIEKAKTAKQKYNINNLQFFEHNLLNQFKFEYKFNLVYSINVLEQLNDHLDKILRNIFNLNCKNIIFYEPDIYFMKKNFIGIISRLRSLKQNKLQNLYPVIERIIQTEKKYSIKSAKNLNIAINPFNSTTEIILNNSKF